jgi:hypothetical protein
MHISTTPSYPRTPSRYPPFSPSCKTSCSARKARWNAPQGYQAFLHARAPTRSFYAIISPARPTAYQDNLGLVQLLLHLHDRIGLLGVLVLCQVLRERGFQFALLRRGQTTCCGRRWVPAKGRCRGRAKRGRRTARWERGEEGRMLVQELGEQRKRRSVRVLEVGDHDG